MGETSQPFDLLVSVDRSASGTLGAQVEEQLRNGLRSGAVRAGMQLPSTRDLARQLGVSRRVAVEAYAQLAAEGYLVLRQGARPRAAHAVIDHTPPSAPPLTSGRPPRFDFRPSIPDVSSFPRAAWLRSLKRALAEITDADLGYGQAVGVERLRTDLAGYLGRARGVVADPARLMVTSGYSQGLGLVCGALVIGGARRIAVEHPSNPEQRQIAARAGLDAVGVAVDGEGIRVEGLERTGADAVVLTPAHQHPTGVVLSGDRRAQLLEWLRERGAVAIEDDYDAEYRYDRAPIGALQGLDPDRVVYAGSASKTLAPALRIGWLVVPERLWAPVAHQKELADLGSARVDQLAFADFLARGELDRHLRRMRARYRRRRDALVEALADELPEARVRGIAAGLHATVELPGAPAERALRDRCAEGRIALSTESDYLLEPRDGTLTLMLGYAQMPEPSLEAGVAQLAAAIRDARSG